MDELKKIKIINMFRRIRAYVSLAELQRIISATVYLFSQSKYKLKKSFSEVKTTDDAIDYLKESGDLNNKDKVFTEKLSKDFEYYLKDKKLLSILNFFDKQSKDKLIEFASEDYESVSRISNTTRKTLRNLCRNILENTKGKNVLDFGSYTGSFLTDYAKEHKDYSFTGIDIDEQSNLIAEVKLRSLNVKNRIIKRNALLYDGKNKYDKIFCESNIGQRLEKSEINKLEKNSQKSKFNNYTIFDAQWGYINSVINALSDSGKAVVIMKNSSLFRLTNRHFREKLIKSRMIEASISLPANVLNRTMMPVSILVLSYNNKSIRFIDARELAVNNGIKCELESDKIFKEYISEEDESRYHKIVEINEIVKNECNLLAYEYVNKKEIKVSNPKKKLKEVCDEIFRGYMVISRELTKQDKEKNEKYKIINIVNVNDGEIDSDLTSFYPENRKIDRYLLENKNLIISAKGIQNKIAVVENKNNERLIPSGNFLTVKLKNEMNPYFLKIFLESKKGMEILESIRTGEILPSITANRLKEIDVPVPSMEEQVKVVNAYITSKEIIKRTEEKLNKEKQKLEDFINKIFI